MFEYAKSHYRKRPPNKRLIGSWIISCLAHAAFLLVLVEYPQLLRHGTSRWFYPANVLEPETKAPDGRFVAYMNSNMEWPTPDQLQQVRYDWSKAGEKPAEPIHVDLPTITVSNSPIPLPKPPEDPDVLAGVPIVPPTVIPPAGTPPDAAAGDPAKPKTEDPTPPGQMVTPKQIPKGIGGDPAGAAGASQAKTQSGGDAVRTAPQKSGTIRPEQMGATGAVLFDTKGFPLDEFALLIRELVNGNWFIPSNLRDSRGSTTVVFYIYQDGHMDGLRTEVTSGIPSLDIAALAAVWNSTFPPLPNGFPAERVGARFVFTYNERH